MYKSVVYDSVDDLWDQEEVGEWVLSESLTGYKKIIGKLDRKEDPLKYFIAQVTIPAGASIIRPFSWDMKKHGPSEKLRTNEYKMDRIFRKPTENIVEAYSMHDHKYKYVEGKTYKVIHSKNLKRECARGLYFFLTKTEAVEYY